MADSANTGAVPNAEQISKILAQFNIADLINARVNEMFKPLLSKLQQETGKRNNTLFDIFFGKEGTSEIKEHVKKALTTVVKAIKTESLIGKIDVKVNKSVNTKPSSNVVKIPALENLIERIDNNNAAQEKRLNTLDEVSTAILGSILKPKETNKKSVDVKPKETTEDLLESKNALNVNIVGISDTALKKLNDILDRDDGIISSVNKDHKPTGATSLLEKLLLAALSGFTAAKLLTAAFADDGPLRGTLKLIGTTLTQIAVSMFKGIVNTVSSFIKVLPRSVLDKLASLSSSLKNIGSHLSEVVIKITGSIGGVLAKIGTTFISAVSKISPVVAKGISSLSGGLIKLAGSMGTFLLKRMKVLPFIGPLLSFGFGINRITKGDYFGGIIEVLAGLVGLVPGLNFIAPFIADIFLAGYDIQQGGIENSKGNSVNTWIKDFGKALLNTGPIRWLRSIGENLGALLTGDYKTGLSGLANAIGDLPVFGYILDLLGASKNNEGKRFEPKDYNIIDKLKNEIFDNLMVSFNWAKGIVEKIRKYFGLDSKQISPEIKTDTQTAIDLRKKISDLKAAEKEEQQKEYLFANVETKNRKLNELVAQRTALENQLETLAQKITATKQKVANVEPQAEIDENLEDNVIIETSPTDDTDEMRQTALNVTSAADTDKIVDAINELKQVQVQQHTTQKEPKVEKKENPISVVSNISQTYKASEDVNVDTVRDSVFIARNNIRNYLYGQRILI